MNRNTKEYLLAERIVFLEDALKTANSELSKKGSLGVLPDHSVSFKNASKHHARVRKTVKEIY